MNLTEEQHAIIRSKDDAVVVAGAGAAKTTTLLYYAKARPKARILYIAYNRSIKEEAIHKFKNMGIENIAIHTAHSLARKSFKNIKIKNGYSLSEIIEICKINSSEPSDSFILAKLIQDAINVYCNKAENTFKAEDMMLYYDKKMVEDYYPLVLKGLKVMTSKMKSGEIPCIHDYYLKLYQLSKPKLPYTHILFDEGQDASPVMLDVFLNQTHATKVIVGDSAQAIYGYRLAVNALDMVSFDRYTLSKSFRFGENIAKLANNVLSWKKLIRTYNQSIKIEGVGGSQSQNNICFLSRSNFGVLKSSILEVEKLNPRSIYFEGGVKGYTFLAFNQTMNDLMSLYYRKHGNIKNPMIKSLSSISDAIKYSEKINDVELGNLARIIQTYGKNLKNHIRYLKSITSEKREYADIIFSTTHKSKGLEYDVVSLSDDFVTLNEIKIFSEVYNNSQNKDIHLEKERQRLNEEINILYVAITRAKNVLKRSYE